MSTMTFLGRTTREAMALAKTRFGADVEIVESRQTDDGVELTAIVHGVPLQRRHLQPQVAAGLKAAPARESTRPQAMFSNVPLSASVCAAASSVAPASCGDLPL